MNKLQYINSRIEKGNNKEEVLADWEKFEKMFEELGFGESEIEQRVILKLQGYYALQDRYPTENFEGIFIGVTETDYGAERQYKKALEIYKASPQEAITMGMVNAEGKPLYMKGANKGKIIDLKISKIKSLIGMIKGEKEKGFVYGELKGIKEVPELFTKVKFKAKRATNQKDVLSVYTAMHTRFETEHKLTDAEVMVFLKENYKTDLVEFKDLKKFAEENQKDFNKLAIIKANVVQIRDEPGRTKIDEITGEEKTKNNMVSINHPDSNEIISCFSLAELKYNFSEVSQDVIMVGKPTVKQDTGEINFRLFGFYTPEKFRVNKKGYQAPQVKEVPKPEEEVPDEAGAW